jgi:hypothetical protein
MVRDDKKINVDKYLMSDVLTNSVRSSQQINTGGGWII